VTRKRTLEILFIGFSVFSWRAAAGSSLTVKVNLSNCTEQIAFGPIPIASVESLVPRSYAIATFGPATAGLVVRASQCQQMTLGPLPLGPVLVAQIGVSIASPDGTGDINNYSLLYVTNSEPLAVALLAAGLPAQVDRTFAYDFTPDSTGSGPVYMAISPVDGPYFLTGTASPPPGPPAPVVANWWFAGQGATVKVSTSIPGIAYGPSTKGLYSGKATAVGQIIGGNSDSNFSLLDARGVFASGILTVTSTRSF
jgi:hypothetical protein